MEAIKQPNPKSFELVKTQLAQALQTALTMFQNFTNLSRKNDQNVEAKNDYCDDCKTKELCSWNGCQKDVPGDDN